MAETVDSIIAELILRTDNYTRPLAEATAAYRKLRAEMEKPIKEGDLASAAARAKQTARDKVQAEEQATASIKKTRKARTDAEIAEAERSKIAERERVAIIKQAVRDEAAAVKAAEAEKRAAITQTRTLQERADARPGNPRRVIHDPVAVAAAPGAPLVRPSPAPASVSNYAPAAAATEQNIAGNAAAKERALLEAEINDRAITQIGLKAQIRAADAEDAVILKDQLFTLQLFGQLRARGLTEAEAQVELEARLLGLEEKRVAAAAEQAALVEKQMRAQSGAIASKISGAGVLTGALVGGLGAAEISHLNDRYIELSNSLKVAGVSAAEFDAVQQHLLTTANKNGTNINTLADVFRSASLGAHDLGASQADLLKLTDAASNALRIQGVSAAQAQGSLLQLGHAFESGRVNAREFNSLALNLYPILQAAAKGSDQFGGSVAKLRQEIIAGNVSSKIFFDAIIAGSGDLEARASKATLTTAQGFTSLTNALVVYFGEADKAQGVSAALGTALQKLGENLDTLIPAITAVGTALTVGYIARMAQAAIATQGIIASLQGFGTSIIGAFGGAAGLAVSALVLTLGYVAVESNKARAETEALNQSIDAQAAKFATVKEAHARAAAETDNLTNSERLALTQTAALTGEADKLASAWGRVAAQAKQAAIAQAQADLDIANGNVRKAQQALADKKTTAQDFTRYTSTGIGGAGYVPLEAPAKVARDVSGAEQQTLAKAQANQRDAQAALKDVQQRALTTFRAAPGSDLSAKDAKALAGYQEKLAGLQKLQANATGNRLTNLNKQIADTQQRIKDIQEGAGAAAARSDNSGVGRGRRGPSADTLAHRAEAARLKGVHEAEAYNTEKKQANDRELQAQVDLADTAEARAALERQRVLDAATENEQNIRLKGPKNPKHDPDINAGVDGTGERDADQTDTLLGINTRTKNLRIQSIDQAERLRQATDARSIDANDANLRREQLQAQEGLADTLAKRRDIAKQLLDLEYDEKAKALRATLNPDSKATPAERTIAQRQLDALPGQKALDQQNLDQQNEGVGRSYLRGLGTDRQQLLEGTEVKVLQDFNSGLDQTVSKALHLHGIFGDIVNDLVDMAVKQALIKPLASSLFSSGDAGGGGFGGLFSTIKNAFGIGGGGGGVSASLSGLSVANTGIPGLGALPGASELSAIAGLPGFASGGSGVIGGRSGVDQNVLSINGQNVARVGKGEMLTVSPNNIAANNARAAAPSGGSTVHQTIAVDARGAVMNDEFASQILSKANQHANAVGEASYRSSVRDAGANVSGIVRRKQTLGG